jgi:hypothetical protein
MKESDTAIPADDTSARNSPLSSRGKMLLASAAGLGILALLVVSIANQQFASPVWAPRRRKIRPPRLQMRINT